MRPATRRSLIVGASASLCTGLAASRARLAEIEARVGGRLGVAALDLASGRRLAWRADERFPMCSIFNAMAVADAATADARDAAIADVGRFVAETFRPPSFREGAVRPRDILIGAAQHG